MSKSKEQQSVNKVTLGSGKVVLLKPMSIKAQNLALQAVGGRAGNNQALMGSLVQQELLKILVVQIDGKAVSHKDLEDLDALFSYIEFQQILLAVNKLSGGDVDDLGKFQTEFVSVG